MFHGGTNFGFTAGGGDVGDIGAPDAYAVADITSYDYDAPLTEAGDYTVKYEFAAELISQYENPKLRRPLRPIQSQKTAYPTLQLQRYLNYTDIIMEIPSSHKILQDKPVSMELLPINNGNGQTFGYIIYRKVANFSPGDRYKVSRPKDLAELLIDGELVDTGFTNAQPQYWFNDIHDIALNVSSGEHTIDLFVDVIARTNWGGRWEHFNQQKGLPEITGSKIEINNIEIQGVEIIALEFTQAWVNGLENWKTVEDDPAALKGPCLVQSSFTIPTTPTDTFLNMSGWHKGVVFVNGFNVGRYWKVGPQQNLYVPAPLLNTGINTIIVFEQFEPSDSIVFSNIPNLGPPFLP
ncbi:Beta-galactosidase-1-like protein 2 [Folsomia candida]|uniref:Beta-galactosidase-1-like protein 2 n=2 Tax=Folsomia candida TaxID=158441 RepID=A0A226CWH5_FOLCA|nr:Beta-galactosidase-1-like protein 2 [Folsomia candida]